MDTCTANELKFAQAYLLKFAPSRDPFERFSTEIYLFVPDERYEEVEDLFELVEEGILKVSGKVHFGSMTFDCSSFTVVNVVNATFSADAINSIAEFHGSIYASQSYLDAVTIERARRLGDPLGTA